MAQYPGPNPIVLRIRRSELRPGDVILRPAPRDLPLARRPQYHRRASSLDRGDFGLPRRGRSAIVRRDEQEREPYESEGSIPPRARARGRARQGPKRDDARSSSSSSSSDLGSTTDDEKKKKKAKLKKWGAIGLAGIATIHAVHGVHESMEKAKKRREELAEGEISEEEAKRRKGKGRWRDAANVGIAAVWIKGAVDEIKEYREAQHEHAEMCENAEERHKKRRERAKSIARGEYHGRHALKDNQREKYYDDHDE